MTPGTQLWHTSSGMNNSLCGSSPVNIVLVILVVTMLCAAALTRMQPHMMRQLSDYLNARADAEDWFGVRHKRYRQEREDRERKWEQERLQAEAREEGAA